MSGDPSALPPQRLGLNRGCYCGETIPIDQIQRDIDQLALGSGWICDTILDLPGKWLPAYRRIVPNARKNIYLSAGIHGDEPSGPLTILRLLRENAWPSDASIWMVPCLNPTGFRANTRENNESIDLNRDYRSFRSIEVRNHIAWLKEQPRFDLTFIFHEDWEAGGFYVYEVNPENRWSFAESILRAVATVCPIETATKVDNWDCRDGVIRPAIKPEDRPEWAESLYLIVNKSPQSYTLETPSDFPLPLRAEAHYRAAGSIFASLERAGSAPHSQARSGVPSSMKLPG
jgi:hypothetical protein